MQKNEKYLTDLFVRFENKEMWFGNDVRIGRSDRWINIIAERI